MTNITKINHANMEEYIRCECSSMRSSDKPGHVFIKDLTFYNSLNNKLINLGNYYIVENVIGYSKSKNNDIPLKKILKGTEHPHPTFIDIYIENNTIMYILQTLIGCRAVTDRQTYINQLGKIAHFAPFIVNDFSP